jgi:MAP/microtubule affinity-regulating kinase
MPSQTLTDKRDGAESTKREKSSAASCKVHDEMINAAITENFSIEKIIGQGSYAAVRLVIEKQTGTKYALKSYSKIRLCDAQRKESVRREITIMQNINHPNITRLYKTIDTHTQLHLVMEFGGSTSLQSYLKSKPQKKLTEADAKGIFRQLAEGIEYLHKNNIAHRDLKLENLLLDSEKTLKIIDFGFSLITSRNKSLDIFCGTPSYMAPELVARKNYFGHLVDIWALGVLLFTLLTGKFPFRAANNKELFAKIMRGQYQIPDDLSPEVRVLIRKMLRMNPHERPSASEILNDKWITGVEESQGNLKEFLSSKIEEYKRLQETVNL